MSQANQWDKSENKRKRNDAILNAADRGVSCRFWGDILQIELYDVKVRKCISTKRIPLPRSFYRNFDVPQDKAEAKEDDDYYASEGIDMITPRYESTSHMLSRRRCPEANVSQAEAKENDDMFRRQWHNGIPPFFGPNRRRCPECTNMCVSTLYEKDAHYIDHTYDVYTVDIYCNTCPNLLCQYVELYDGRKDKVFYHTKDMLYSHGLFNEWTKIKVQSNTTIASFYEALYENIRKYGGSKDVAFIPTLVIFKKAYIEFISLQRWIMRFVRNARINKENMLDYAIEKETCTRKKEDIDLVFPEETGVVPMPEVHLLQYLWVSCGCYLSSQNN